MDTGAADTVTEAAPLSEYELARLRTVERNLAVLHRLGLGALAGNDGNHPEVQQIQRRPPSPARRDAGSWTTSLRKRKAGGNTRPSGIGDEMLSSSELGAGVAVDDPCSSSSSDGEADVDISDDELMDDMYNSGTDEEAQSHQRQEQRAERRWLLSQLPPPLRLSDYDKFDGDHGMVGGGDETDGEYESDPGGADNGDCGGRGRSECGGSGGAQAGAGVGGDDDGRGCGGDDGCRGNVRGDDACRDGGGGGGGGSSDDGANRSSDAPDSFPSLASLCCLSLEHHFDSLRHVELRELQCDEDDGAGCFDALQDRRGVATLHRIEAERELHMARTSAAQVRKRKAESQPASSRKRSSVGVSGGGAADGSGSDQGHVKAAPRDAAHFDSLRAKCSFDVDGYWIEWTHPDALDALAEREGDAGINVNPEVGRSRRLPDSRVWRSVGKASASDNDNYYWVFLKTNGDGEYWEAGDDTTPLGPRDMAINSFIIGVHEYLTFGGGESTNSVYNLELQPPRSKACFKRLSVPCTLSRIIEAVKEVGGSLLTVHIGTKTKWRHTLLSHAFKYGGKVIQYDFAMEVAFPERGIQVYDKSRARYDRRQQTPRLKWHRAFTGKQDQRMWVWNGLTPDAGAPRIAAASDFLQEHIQHWEHRKPSTFDIAEAWAKGEPPLYAETELVMPKHLKKGMEYVGVPHHLTKGRRESHRTLTLPPHCDPHTRPHRHRHCNPPTHLPLSRHLLILNPHPHLYRHCAYHPHPPPPHNSQASPRGGVRRCGEASKASRGDL